MSTKNTYRLHFSPVQASIHNSLMLSNFKTAFRPAPTAQRAPRGTQIRGDYKELIPRVQNDINITTAHLAQYESRSLLRKIIQLMKKNHKEQVEGLSKEYGETAKYDEKLFHLLKGQLSELGNLLDIFKNNFIHSLYDNHLLDYKRRKSNSESKVSSDSSGSSVSLLSMNEGDADAPDYLLDPISFEMLTDPVVTPSGITYEKEEILNHINKKGKYDPISKQPLSKDQLYPNLIIKDTVEAFKEEHSKQGI